MCMGGGVLVMNLSSPTARSLAPMRAHEYDYQYNEHPLCQQQDFDLDLGSFSPGGA